MTQPINPFRLNQLGYPENASKRFIYTGESQSNVNTREPSPCVMCYTLVLYI